jgi:hypothetical protein
MWTDNWLSTESSFGVALFAQAFSHRVAYRLHEIVIDLEGDGASAKVYDGAGLVYQAHGFTEAEALERAHTWIDEQALSLPAFDLHDG